MIGKGTSIAHTGTSIDYGWNQEKDAEIVFSQHLAGNSPQEITEEFRLIQEENARCQKNTLSFILSPTQEDGRNLSKQQLGELTQKFIKEMQLKERQAIAFVHRDKEHTHVHLYVNRIGFDGKAYNDSFIGKRSQLAAENVAKEMGLTTVKEVQLEKELDSIKVRLEIKDIHHKVMETERLKTLDSYIKA
ncbi:MAG: relaxase/mobilization nuclease domain-containing protein, partial [Maribacter sp.]